MAAQSSSTDGFVAFFRAYTRTWVHTVAAAGLTAFGTLTIVHRWFAFLAVGSYVLIPVSLYLWQGRTEETIVATADRENSTESRGRERRGSANRAENPNRDARTNRGGGTERTTGERTAASSEGVDDGTSDTTGETETREAERTDMIDERDGEEGGRKDDEIPSDPPSETALTAASGADDRSSAGRDTDSNDGDTDDEGGGVEWTAVASPTEATLFDAVVTSSGAWAAGANGVVLTTENGEERTTEEWTVTLEDGPGARSNDLRGVDATIEGDAVWVAGDGGAVGRIDTATGRHTDYSAPADRTDNLAGIATAGSDGDETILLINGSGEVLQGRYRDGDLSWSSPTTPGSGSSLCGVEFVDDSVGYCCDTNDGVFETTDGGDSFERIGLDTADGTLTDLASVDRGDCLATADDGVVHRLDGTTWTPERVGEDSLQAIDRRDDRTAICEPSAVVERVGASDWKRYSVEAPGPLESVAIGSDRSIAVGANGAVFERR